MPCTITLSNKMCPTFSTIKALTRLSLFVGSDVNVKVVLSCKVPIAVFTIERLEQLLRKVLWIKVLFWDDVVLFCLMLL